MLYIRQYTEADKNTWDTYVHSHSQATLYHRSGWKNVIENTYGHKTYYLMAMKEKPGSWEAERLGKHQLKEKSEKPPSFPAFEPQAEFVVGILPLVHINHFLFGNSLISVPFLDYGGILADDQETEIALLNEAIKLTKNIGAKSIELRQINPIKSLEPQNQNSELKIKNFSIVTHSHKVRMLIELPESSEELMKSFKSKLRSQIRKPLKEGLTAAVGGVELLDDFYIVFVQNMRDLGSPVHSKLLIKSVVDIYPKESRIVVIYRDRQPLACGFVAGFKNTLENPWASSLRKYSKLAPNMLLYWTMLEYACGNGFNSFDFGRSTPDGGTFKFKSQWGGEPVPLHWYYIATDGNKPNKFATENQAYGKAIDFWKKLPVQITKIVGPPIRKYIGL